MENAFILGDQLCDDFIVTGQAFTIGVIFLEYCEMKNMSPPPADFTDSQRRETTFLFLKLINLPELPHRVKRERFSESRKSLF